MLSFIAGSVGSAIVQKKPRMRTRNKRIEKNKIKRTLLLELNNGRDRNENTPEVKSM